ncbi:MAG: DNA-directed DNA polymerase [Rhodothalassiaceae bacterium]|nr:MAG: DNA-directed DNA polymerase [Rhodothalassiaceae bacterium]
MEASRANGTPENGLSPFVHLRVHSAYSLLEGALHIAEIARLCREHRMPAVAVTDSANLFGALEFSETMAKAGVQPIIGVTLPVVWDGEEEAHAARRPGRALPKIVLLVQDETGYRNLLKIVSRAHLDSADPHQPATSLDRLAAHHAGLICLSGGIEGPVGEAVLAGDLAGAEARARRLAELFPGRFYMELQRHGLAAEARAEPHFIAFAYAHDWPLVATNQCYFPDPGMYEAHDALLCIKEGTVVAESARRRVTREHWFKSGAKMAALFADLPEAVRNTLVIARRCAFRPRPHKPILPRFESPEGLSEEELLRRRAESGLENRLASHVFRPDDDAATRERKARPYRERLAYELDVITRMGFAGYFLIVSDFISWAKEQRIPVGPGRGSGAGSLVAWALRITELDPLRFSLLFERFLNPERVSMPDFDIDFCQERREEVIRYVQSKYGADRVAQIITFGKLQARAVLRDVGRVLEQPYPVTDRLCKLVPNNPADPKTLAEVLEEEPRLAEARRRDPLTDAVITRALRLEGLYRHASTHAAGVVIGDRPLDELIPLYRDPRADMPVTQFNMKWVEQAGLVKFDFLGLKTLTVLRRAAEFVAGTRGVEVDLDRIPLDDPATFAMLGRGETAGVFQLESAGMRQVLKELKPDKFEDIIAIVALYRPGPMDNIPLYVNRKHGREPIDYPHPLLEDVLKETYGVIIYQEQVMQIAQILAGYTLGEADLLRRAMGKKIKAEMDRQRSRFVEGAAERGVDRQKAEEIFELVAKFAGYGFNKSHAAAYALVAYQTAYMKAHFPEEFMAASMALDVAHTDKLAAFAKEVRAMQIPLLAPDINRSHANFAVERLGDGRLAIRYALAAIKGVGEKAMEAVVAAREKGGPFRSLADFARRVDPQLLNRRQIEQLAAAGAFDALEPERARVHAGAEAIMRLAQERAEARARGQSSLFGEETLGGDELRLPEAEAWSVRERLAKEQEAIGFYLSEHPLSAYRDALARLRVRSSVELADPDAGFAEGQVVKLAGVIDGYHERRARQSGDRFGVLRLSDADGGFEVLVFREQLEVARHLVDRNLPVLVEAELRRRNGEEEWRLQARSLADLDAALARIGMRVVVRLADPAAAAVLARALEPARGGRGLVEAVVPIGEGCEAVIELGRGFEINPLLIGELARLPGVLAAGEA